MKSNQGINDVTANVLLGLKPILEVQKPDLLLVHGDTSTTLAASMAGFSKIDEVTLRLASDIYMKSPS